MKKSKDYGCPSLKGNGKVPTCEDGTFESSIVSALVSDFLNNADKIGYKLTWFGDADNHGENLFDAFGKK